MSRFDHDEALKWAATAFVTVITTSGIVAVMFQFVVQEDLARFVGGDAPLAATLILLGIVAAAYVIGGNQGPS